MGFFDSFLSNEGSAPSYIRKQYEKYGLDTDNEVSNVSNQGKKMYCTMCRKIYNGGYKCGNCNNILV